MSIHYQYVLSFNLAEDCPATVTKFFQSLADGHAPDELPESDEVAMEVGAGEVASLLVNRTHQSGARVTVVGSATADEFYMPFIALTEWLARWSGGSGPVGYYHTSDATHPTLIYFAAGKPYMLQATGTPVGLADGAAMPTTSDTGLDTEGENGTGARD